MKNEITQRREGSVLYEPPEPLFPDLPPRRPRMLVRAVACLVILCVAIFIMVIVVSASGRGEGDFGTEKNTLPVEHENETATEDTEWESDEETEEVTDNSHFETESAENETVTPPRGVIEVDLSLAERGDGYIVNYTDKKVDIEGLLDRGFVGAEENGGAAPVVMILHTHTSEEYYGSKNEYLDGVISVGDALSARLNTRGLNTLHCTVIHDGGEGNAYISARETIDMMLKVYPSIKYVIDLHRMELESDGLPIKTVSSEGLAQIRLTVSASGEGWQEDLSLALAIRQGLNKGDARLCMPPVLSSSRYNSDMSAYYLMIDIGASGNTAREAVKSAERLAEAICDAVIAK